MRAARSARATGVSAAVAVIVCADALPVSVPEALSVPPDRARLDPIVTEVAVPFAFVASRGAAAGSAAPPPEAALRVPLLR